MSCATKIFKFLLRCRDAGVRLTRAALMPISAYRIVQTIGNTIGGGDRGDCKAVSPNAAVALRDSRPESMPTASVREIHIAYVFQFDCFRTSPNIMIRAGRTDMMGHAFFLRLDKWNAIIKSGGVFYDGKVRNCPLFEPTAAAGTG